MALLGHLAACGGGHEAGQGPVSTRPVSSTGPTALAQRVYVKPSNTGARDMFGSRVALAEETLVVAATREDGGARGVGGNQDDESASDSGAVYAFRHTPGGWQEEAYLKASNPGASDGFGLGLALSGDTLAVGASGEDSAAAGVDGNQDDDSARDSGAVYVFRRLADGWRQEAYIKASNTGAGDEFGGSVALSGDTLVVAAMREDSASAGVNGAQQDDGAGDSGAVYVFRRSATGWQQEAYLKAAAPVAGARFGASVALSGDVLAVGAPGKACAGDGAEDCGAVHVFRRSAAGWHEEASFAARETDRDDMFGDSVALHGHVLVAGAPFSDGAAVDPGPGSNRRRPAPLGAAYVFLRTESGWQQEAALQAAAPAVLGMFGRVVSVHGDLVAVGAEMEAGVITGPDGTSRGRWGGGAAYVFRRAGTTWHQQRIRSEHTKAKDFLGSSVAVFDGMLAVGAPGEDSAAAGLQGNPENAGAEQSGAVYLFQ